MAPATATPPALPPSVEEAYRRKCIQLKARTAEVEEANDAARLRLNRIKRQVEKMRLERAFLLEQLAKRTSTNVEDSDGSPSPPPTPKEKPLRIKRGHRKTSMLTSFDTPTAGPSSVAGGAAGTSFLGRTHSPSSDAFSTQPGDGKPNGSRLFPPKKPGSAFELYCDERRAEQRLDKEDKPKDGDAEDEDEQRLARGWKDLTDSRREEFEARAEDEMAQYQKEKEAYEAKEAAKKDDDMDVDSERRGPSASVNAAGETPQPQDQDVEMGNYDSDQETQGEKTEE